MSRGVRDLRDLICVSRLTIRESDEEEFLSDDDGHGKLGKENSLASITGDLTDSKSDSPSNSRVISPDSGFVNGSPGISSSAGMVSSADYHSHDDNFFITVAPRKDLEEPLQAGTARFHSQKKKKKKKNDRKLPLEPTKHELPRPARLPPVQTSWDLSNDSTSAMVPAKSKSTKQSRVIFDDMMIYLDAAIVAQWLIRANATIEDMSEFCNKGDHFVHFARFWLSDFADLQKRDIFRMEYDILIDEVTLAFTVGKENGNIVRRDILDLLGAVFKEYPLKLLSAKGSHIFLNYLDILTSEKREPYKRLLSDVRCSTKNPQYAQWLLAVRSFAIVNVWTSVMNFYRNLISDLRSNPVHELWSSTETPPIRRMLQAIRLGYIDVIHYLIASDHVNPSHTDSHGRTLIFSAVMHNQVDVVLYFIKKIRDLPINLAADTGNTPLHAASNSGNLPIVEILCQCDDIDVNCKNKQCEDVTPLHLAIMHGHSEIVECLLKHGADLALNVGCTTVFDLARDFEQDDILERLQNKFR